MKASSFSIFLITFSIISSGCLDESQDSGFWGTELSPPAPTPNFQLTNQHNESINFTSFEGNILVVSFIFTPRQTDKWFRGENREFAREKNWCPQGDLNPRRRRERAVS